MSKQRHIIGRTVIELNTKQLGDVWSLQEDVSRLFKQEALEEIARLFDQLVAEEEVVRLDQLVVDIGSIDSRFLADEFIHTLLIAIKESLGDHLTDRLLNHNAAQPEVITRDRSDWQVLLYFLRYGRLPWWCPVKDWQEWRSRWLAVMQNDTNWRHSSRELLINNPATSQRLVEQFPESFRHQLVLHLQPTWINWHNLLKQARQIMQSLSLDRNTKQYLEKQAWLLLLEKISSDNESKRALPITWNQNWLNQLIQMWLYSGALIREAQKQGGWKKENSNPSTLYQIAHQRLRIILTTFPDNEQSLWLTALDETLNSITETFTTSSEQNREQEEQVNISKTDGEMLLYFLQYGRFPENQLSVNWQYWLSCWSEAIENDTTWYLPLQQLLINNPEVRQRLVTQLPEDLRSKILLRLQPSWINYQDLLAQAIKFMQALRLSQNIRNELLQQAWLLIFAEISSDNTPERPLPKTKWAYKWLMQVLKTLLMSDYPTEELGEQTVLNRDTPISPSTSYQIVHQRLHTILAAFPHDEQSLWLPALDKALTSIIDITGQNQKETFTTSSEQNREQEEQVNIPKTDGEMLLYFLQYGRFPENQLSPDWQYWLSRWSEAIENDTSWCASLRQLLVTNPEVQQRLVTQLAEDLRSKILLRLQPSWINYQDLLTQMAELIQALRLSDQIYEELLQQAWLLLFAEVDLNEAAERPLPVENWIHNWLTQLLKTGLEAPEVSTINQSQYQHLRTIIATLDISENTIWSNALKQVLSTTSTNTIASPVDWQRNPITKANNNSILSKEEETSGLYISQAGLVLLNPFIRFYLEAVGLLNNELFRDESAQQTAIYLLYYLATRQTDAPEYELVLPKLLCGWSLNQPVVRGLHLPEIALEEGEILLQTVINYWDVLKNTHPDGLREGFLQRQGKLTHNKDGKWTLQVEQQAIDVLLSKLPWGISMFKLPWMQEMLTVEWV